MKEKINVYIFKYIHINKAWMYNRGEYESKMPGLLYKLLKDSDRYFMCQSVHRDEFDESTNTFDDVAIKKHREKDKYEYDRKVAHNLNLPLSRINFIECFDKIIIDRKED